MRKLVIAVIVMGGIGFLGWQIYQRAVVSSSGPQTRRGDVAVAVEVAPVKQATIREIGLFTGSLYPLSEFVVAPKIAGRLEKILVNIGDSVKAGQLIAVLDDEEYQQQVSQAMAELEVAQANLQESRNTLENTRREFERTVVLRQKKIASESQLDAAESDFKTQQAKLKVTTAQISQKTAALEMAKVRLSYAEIRVPENHAAASRVVGERYVDEGAMLAPNTPIVSILDIGTLLAVIHVIERDYPKIQPGLETIITTDAFPGQTFSGKVLRIAPLLKEKSREARVEVEIRNEQTRLKPGMFVRAQIEFDQHPNATVVPVSALVKRNGTQGVFVVDLKGKKARFVPITTGIVNDTQAEVLSPELSGMVATLGQHMLEDGSTVVLPDKQSENDVPASDNLPESKPAKIAG
jgi:RND family efflux transporter MFP subunit